MGLYKLNGSAYGLTRVEEQAAEAHRRRPGTLTRENNRLPQGDTSAAVASGVAFCRAEAASRGVMMPLTVNVSAPFTSIAANVLATA